MADQKAFINRDVSWLAFNNRVLAEANDVTNPLFERLLSLSFVVSNKEEFIAVRLASYYIKLKDYKNAFETQNIINELVAGISNMNSDVDSAYKNLCALLKTSGIDVSAYDKKWASEYFDNNIKSSLKIRRIVNTQPLPLLKEKTLHIALMLDNQLNSFTLVEVPDNLARLVEMPSEEGKVSLTLIERIVIDNLYKLFPNKKIRNIVPFRIIRSAETPFDDTLSDDYVATITNVLQMRKYSEVMCMEVPKNSPQELVALLAYSLNITKQEIYKTSSPLGLSSVLRAIYKLKNYDRFKFPKFIPYLPKELSEYSIFSEISKNDHLLFHPFDSFAPVIRLIEEAADDENVLSIKQTLYRVSSNSPIIAGLVKAAQNGKQVTVFMELKARFDEKNNLGWGKKLTEAGCNVIYGLPGLKTHSKITLVVRAEGDTIKKYLHLGTGNYHDVTAKAYTDMGVLTCDEELGNDAMSFFEMLNAHSAKSDMSHMQSAPFQLRNKIEEHIRKETENALCGLPARIDAKMNALVDPSLVKLLYTASQAGVKINLVVRSSCSLIPGIAGLSENITVHSIVGRFLEHSRIFRFENAGEPALYMSSADWMPRNLDKRVELLFPVKDPLVKQRVEEILRIQQLDTEKSWTMMSDGKFVKTKSLKPGYAINSQQVFIESKGWRFKLFDINKYSDRP